MSSRGDIQQFRWCHTHVGWLCGSMVGGLWMVTVLCLDSGRVTEGHTSLRTCVW